MLRKKLIVPVLIAFLVADFTFSFLQYYHTPLNGDLIDGVLPSQDVLHVFNDPFGFQSVATGESHINPNRFFSHWLLTTYLRNVPHWLQYFVTPITSVYLASALLKISVQIAFVFLLSVFLSGKRIILSKQFLLCAAIVAPLFQVYGYWSRMGIVDKSIVYTFFYAVPLVLLMTFFLPFFTMIQEKSKFKTGNLLYLLPHTIILPLSGPLIPGVVLITSFLIFLSYFFSVNLKGESSFFRQFVNSIKSIPIPIYLLIPICLWSLYALFLARYDNNYLSETIPLVDRYLRLPMGLYSQVFHSFGFPMLLVLIGLNTYLIKRNFYTEGGRDILNTLKWIGIFAGFYLILLPLGGYRPYRPNLIRYDTFMPVTVALMYVFGASSRFLFSKLNGKQIRKYRIGIVLVLAIYVLADTSGFHKNDCERHALETLANSSSKFVKLQSDCTILSWSKTENYQQSEGIAEVLQYWRITKEKILFYQE